MRAIDTNVLVRLLTQDDLRQAASAEAFIEQGAWVSVVALAEAIWVLETVYDRGPAAQAAALEMLLDHRSLTMQDSDAVSDALDVFRDKPSLGFSDCLILQLARKAGHVPLGTFDRALARLEGTRRL